MCPCMNEIQRDCVLIMEAIRRLRDGTWRLDQEDLDQAQHLIPMVRSAITDHIQFEEKFLFPQLEKSELEAHMREHAEILSVLWGIETSLREQSPERFHAFLDVLRVILDIHHREKQKAPEEQMRSNVIKIDFMKRISQRSQNFLLESL